MTTRARTDPQTQTAGQWRAWAESRLVNAEALVDRLRAQARDAVLTVVNLECPYCEVRITVPRQGDTYLWNRAWAEHELIMEHPEHDW
jgi:hypothetical protein